MPAFLINAIIFCVFVLKNQYWIGLFVSRYTVERKTQLHKNMFIEQAAKNARSNEPPPGLNEMVVDFSRKRQSFMNLTNYVLKGGGGDSA